MFFAKYVPAYASAFALASVLASGCGPNELDGDSVRKPLRTTGVSSPNSRQAFGGNVNNVSMTGLFQSATPRGDGTTSPTGYWMRTPTEDKYAPVLAITMDGLPITSVSAAQGVLELIAEDGSAISASRGDMSLVFEIGAPVSAQLWVKKAIAATGGYTNYVAEWSTDGQEWASYCPHPYVSVTGVPTMATEYMIPVGGARWGTNGARYDDAASIQLSCSHDSIGGCVTWGYAPWRTVTGQFGNAIKPETISLKNAHQACTRAKRADICGDGDTLTTMNAGASEYEHTTIQVWDAYSIRPIAEQTGTSMEAHWGVNGALCVNQGEFRSNDSNFTSHLTSQLLRPGCQRPACSNYAGTGLISTSRVCLDIDDEGHCIGN